ncbi:AEC family transporter [Parvibaculum sp.]|jgi:malonate transporter|uniref:AEC family transporter n=1 Tax=Parvibaculum sp. TaxID=2024848 RepID=UPI003C7409CF
MDVALSLVLPIFGIILFGYAGARLKLISHSGVDGLDTYVFTFAMPVLLFRNLAHTAFPASLPWELWISYYGAMLTVWALGSFVAHFILRRPTPDTIMLGFGSGQGNTIMLGLPIILTGFGPEAGIPVFLILAFHGIILFTIATFLLELTRARDGAERPHLGAILKEGLINTLRNPVIIGIGCGVVYGQLGVPLPAIADTALEMVARSAIPCALFVLGAMLTRYSLRQSVGAASVTSFFKLIVHPALVFLLTHFVFGLEPLWVTAATLLAAMPTGVYSSILANRYQAAPGAASSAVVLSTALSLFTLTVLLGWFL